MKYKHLVFLGLLITSQVSMAENKISGTHEVKVEYTDNQGGAIVEQDLDILFTANIDETLLTISIEDIGRDRDFNGTADYELIATQLFIDTKLAGLDYKIGTYETTYGNGILNAASNGKKFMLTKDINGFSASMLSHSGENGELNISTNFSGVEINAQNITRAERFLSASLTVADILINAEYQNTSAGVNSGYSLSKVINDIDFLYENVKIRNPLTVTQYNGNLENISSATDKASGFSAYMSTSYGGLKFKSIKIDDVDTHSVKLYRDHMSYKYEKTDAKNAKIYLKTEIEF